MENLTTAIDVIREEKREMELRILSFIIDEARAFEKKTGISPRGYSIYTASLGTIGKADLSFVVTRVSVDIDI